MGYENVMKVFAFLMIACLYTMFSSASATAGPIFPFSNPPAYMQGFVSACVTSGCITSSDNRPDILSVPFPMTDSYGKRLNTPRMALAGMWVLQSPNGAGLQETGSNSRDCMTPLFVGSLLVSLSGFIRRLSKPQRSDRHEVVQMRSRTPYEKILSAEM